MLYTCSYIKKNTWEDPFLALRCKVNFSGLLPNTLRSWILSSSMLTPFLSKNFHDNSSFWVQLWPWNTHKQNLVSWMVGLHILSHSFVTDNGMCQQAFCLLALFSVPSGVDTDPNTSCFPEGMVYEMLKIVQWINLNLACQPALTGRCSSSGWCRQKSRAFHVITVVASLFGDCSKLFFHQNVFQKDVPVSILSNQPFEMQQLTRLIHRITFLIRC